MLANQLHVTSFVSAWPTSIMGEAAMYYGFYLFAIALAVMIGQLAFALYQVASFFLS